MIEQAKQMARRALERINLKRDYQETFSTPHGKRVLADIMKRTGVTAPQFHSDPGVTQFREGARHIGFSIFRQVHSSVDPLLALQSEEIRKQEDNVQ